MVGADSEVQRPYLYLKKHHEEITRTSSATTLFVEQN